MEILDLNMKKYGKFSDHQITFRSGLNVIYGGNESGKTTIFSFIRAMLFGLGRGRGRAANLDEYQLRQPWDTPGVFLGSMRFMEDGKVYRIDRCFDRSTRPLSLVCETDAWESADPQKDLDALLGGISETAFVNSVCIPQLHCETNEGLAEELRRYMINSDTSGDGSIDVTRALQTLRRKKKQQEQLRKKDEEELEEKINQKQREADALRGEIEQLCSQHIDAQDDVPFADSLDWIQSGTEDEKETEQAGGVSPWLRRLLCGMLVFAAVLTAAGIFLTDSLALSIFLGIFTVLFGSMAIGIHFLFTPARTGNGEGKGDFPDNSALSQTIRERQETYQKLQEELETLYQQHTGAQTQDGEIEALTMAIDRICDISNGIFAANGGKLNEKASKILDEITLGRYSRITIDDTAEVRIHTPTRVLGLNQVSCGTMQQIYFSLRMAAGDLFCPDRQLPVIFDESFAMYDDERLEAVLSWLKRTGRQAIIFTCQMREREIMKRI